MRGGRCFYIERASGRWARHARAFIGHDTTQTVIGFFLVKESERTATVGWDGWGDNPNMALRISHGPLSGRDVGIASRFRRAARRGEAAGICECPALFHPATPCSGIRHNTVKSTTNEAAFPLGNVTHRNALRPRSTTRCVRVGGATVTVNSPICVTSKRGPQVGATEAVFTHVSSQSYGKRGIVAAWAENVHISEGNLARRVRQRSCGRN
jgi:hypothetical protein